MEQVLSILEADRIWSAYALADLEPDHQPYSNWYLNAEGLLLRYRGLEPPILFAMGDAERLKSLLAHIPGGSYQISFPESVLASMPANITILDKIPMWRMWIGLGPITQSTGIEVSLLGADDLEAIEQLYEGRPDAPDGFHPRQLGLGPFRGVWREGSLVATAGIHVLSTQQSIAAIGNIYTHPDWRGKGFAKACTISILSKLYQTGLATAVLNVEQANQKAIQLYSSLGFKFHASFFEGTIHIETTDQIRE
jgi:ribosomal protein S18 acetylase RimI-like enzyme